MQQLRKAAKRLSEAGGSQLELVQREIRSAEDHLKRQVLYEKQKAVYESHCEALKVMPISELEALREVNSYEGVTRCMMLLRYGSGVEVPFER